MVLAREHDLAAATRLYGGLGMGSNRGRGQTCQVSTTAAQESITLNSIISDSVYYRALAMYSNILLIL